MRLVITSDTHELHAGLKVPDGDVFIHAGDFTMYGEPPAILVFEDWVKRLPHKHKIIIPGNHDRSFDHETALYPSLVKFAFGAMRRAATVLNEEGIEIDGVKFWGSPINPRFHDWAFNRNRGNEIRAHWDKIPNDTHVLITHGPPLGILDTTTPDAEHLGDWDLADIVENRVKPSFHIFGHIHGGAGQMPYKETYYINASALDEAYDLVNQPIVVDL
jgi:Icc-related predicted phosphoesterase